MFSRIIKYFSLILLFFTIFNIAMYDAISQESNEKKGTIGEGYDLIKEKQEDKQTENQENSSITDELKATTTEGLNFRDQRPVYQSKGKRDPFKPFLKTPKEEQILITKTTPPIKRFALEEFRIVGIVWLDNVPKAMVVDPENNTYFLGKDDEIGNRSGVIMDVRENGILVREQRFFEDVFGQKKVEVKESVLAFVQEE